MTSTLNDNVLERMFNTVNNKSQEITEKVKGALAVQPKGNAILPGDDPTYKGWGANPAGNPTTPPQEKNNTLLYVGIGAAVLLGAYFMFKK